MTASPNPVPAGEGLGTTTITWTTGDGSVGRVFASRDGEPEVEFAAGPEGAKEARWIAAGSRYHFRLYVGADRSSPLASVTVTRDAANKDLRLIDRWLAEGNTGIVDPPDLPKQPNETVQKAPEFAKSPHLSVVVVMYRMSEQIGNTLYSLTPPYQRSVQPDTYEIILVDNGSPEPLPQEVLGIADNVRYHYISPDRASTNPGKAMNSAVQVARAPILCLMIDGARMVTPGVLRWGTKMTHLSTSAVTEVRGWHLGPKIQSESIQDGYNQEVERRLLGSVRWQENGYRLFEISVPSGSTRFGFFDKAYESGCLFMHRSTFDALGGYDERYRYPGGGLVNLDFFYRAVTTATTVFTLLGEGHFHQMHGGASTGLRREERPFHEWRVEYERLSRPFGNPPPYDPILVGHIPKECRRWLVTDSMR